MSLKCNDVVHLLNRWHLDTYTAARLSELAHAVSSWYDDAN